MKHNESVKAIRVNNLKMAARSKKEKTREKAHNALKKLLSRGEKITYASVAREADVSVAYLYKEPDINETIRKLRANYKMSDLKVREHSHRGEGQEKIITVLKTRLEEMKIKNQSLRRQNEKLAGQLYELVRENEALKSHHSMRNSTGAGSSASISPAIKELLCSLKIKPVESFEAMLLEYEGNDVLNALESLREAERSGNVRSRTGYLIKALKNKWMPNDTSQTLKAQRDEQKFSLWFEQARSEGRVIASRRNNGQLEVYMSDGRWVPYEELLLVESASGADS